MPTFGFSAFLKLVSLNPRPQRTEVLKRSIPSDSGYDFHRSLRRLAHRYVVDGKPFPEVLLEAEDVSSESERRSVKAGLAKLNSWRELNPGNVLNFDTAHFESPAKNFKVQYSPNFGVELGGSRVAIHVWNTAVPDLDERMTYAALSLFSSSYDDYEVRPDDLAVLSLPGSRLYRLSDVSLDSFSEIAKRLVRRLDDLFEEIRSDPSRPSAPPKRRSPPPPSP